MARTNTELKNAVATDSITGDSFKRQLCLAYGLGIIDKRHYDALTYLNRIRNKWAHEEDVEMDIKDTTPLLNMLSSEAASEVNTHRDTLYGHLRHVCDVVCNEMAVVLQKQQTP